LLHVANAPKNQGASTPPNAAELPFEQALKRLESIVEAMEAEDLPLENLLANYQEGTGLARICQQRLAEAELKIQQLEENASGEFKLKGVDLEKPTNGPGVTL
jgi:exodeoxyribonuclease VII small subunit